MRKFILFFFLFSSFGAMALESKECFSKAEMDSVSSHFSQFKSYTSFPVCRNKMGDRLHFLMSGLLLLKNLELDLPGEDPSDEMTLKHVKIKDWWSYLTDRVHYFDVSGSQCRGPLIAFVLPSSRRGVVFLCSRFFDRDEFDIFSAISFFLHEARHFEGYRHVECNQGPRYGGTGYSACDTSIRLGGSYAVSVQALVGLASSSQISYRQKTKLESQAIYLALDRFNRAVKIQVESQHYLSHENGEVYSWNPDNPEEAFTKIAQLKAPSFLVAREYLDWDVYPLDGKTKAHNLSRSFQKKNLSKDHSRGVSHFNSTSDSERSLYKEAFFADRSVWFFTDTYITTWCGKMGKELERSDMSFIGELKSFLSITDSTSVINEKGEFFWVSCVRKVMPARDEMTVRGTSISWNMDQPFIRRGFSAKGKMFGFLENGQLVELIYDSSEKKLSFKTINISLPNKGWLSGGEQVRLSIF